MKFIALAGLAAIALASSLSTVPSFAQSNGSDDISALKSEIEDLKRGQLLILRELEAVRKALGATPGAAERKEPAAPGQVTLRVAGAPFLGDSDAPVTLIEFSDYQCPYCRRHYQPILEGLKQRYIGTGQIKYVMQEFPIESIHPFAFKASEAALCAGEQGGYWTMHDRIFDNPRHLRVRDFLRHAEDLDLDVEDLKDCLDEGKFAARIRDSLALGSRLGVRGTPSFFVAITDPDDPQSVQAIEFIRGAVPLGEFTRAIDAALARAGQS